MKKWVTLLIAGLCVSIVTIAIICNLFFEKKANIAQTITQDINLLARTLHKIHADCKITKFTNLKNPLTFLNVVKFAGSEVGTVNVARPKRFKGPYLQDNPSLYGIEYQVINTENGLFIVPGDTVKLPNGKIIDKDIMFTVESDIEEMLYDENALSYKGVALGKKLDFDEPEIEDLEPENVKEFDSIVEEYMED